MSTLRGGIDVSLVKFLGRRGLRGGMCASVSFIFVVGGIFLLRHGITRRVLCVLTALAAGGGVHHCFDDDGRDCTGDINSRINSCAD